VRLSQILKVQLLGQLDNARRGSDVKGAGPLALGLQGIANLAVRERLGLNRNDAERIWIRKKLAEGNVKFACIFYVHPQATSSSACMCLSLAPLPFDSCFPIGISMKTNTPTPCRTSTHTHGRLAHIVMHNFYWQLPEIYMHMEKMFQFVV